MPLELWEQAADYRDQERLPSSSAAVRELIRYGLEHRVAMRNH
jgi:hypothetical protein